MPRAKVTLEYDDNNKPLRIDAIVVSTSACMILMRKKKMLKKITKDIVNILVPRVQAKYKKVCSSV
jgi:S-adenosylmethionine synthetase